MHYKIGTRRTDMERLSDFAADIVNDLYENSDWYGDRSLIEAAINRLAAYKDTGLEPEEVNVIAGLASENCAKVADKIDQLLSDDKELEQYRALGPIDRLRELKQADDEGRCVVCPCKVGDKLYEVERYRNSGKVEIVERIVQSIEFFADGYYVKMYRWRPCKETNGVLSQKVDSWVKIEDFGRTVFFARKDAEAALRRELE
jgi:hypothetical protein